MKPGDDPHAEYARRLQERQAVAARLDERHRRLGNAKVAVFAMLVLMGWIALTHHWFRGWWLLAPGAVLAALVIAHERVIRARLAARRASGFYEKGLARIEDRWAGTGEPGDRFDDPSHPYAEDLDLFGKGSLFELLCTTRLRTGEETLARFLLEPAAPEVVRARQEAVAELRPRLDLREEMALLGEDLRSGINPRALATWAEQPLTLDSRAARATAAALVLAALAALAAWALTGVVEYFLGVVVVEAVFFVRCRARVVAVAEVVGEPAYGIALFAEVLGRLERERFTSARLLELRAELDTEGVPPSHAIARLDRLMDLLHSRDNVAVRIIGPPLLWTTQVAFAIEAWRKKYGRSVRRWLAAVGEIETLSGFGSYAYEHPADPFPEFAEGEACFEGEGLGHPLVPESRSVRNDIRLSSELRVQVVSGSNMSGKSTLLRIVGVNAVLANAGAPVRARRLRLTPLAVGASIRTLDSLQGGTSRFYTEIKRLRQLVDLARGPRPLLFLLDELLHGTNSHDRRIGAEAVIRTLVERDAIGLLTTHDLALAQIVEVLAPRAANVHFEDHLEDGKITFDYLLLPGLVRKSNALELMRSVGLDV
jgi:hypothetical protein